MRTVLKQPPPIFFAPYPAARPRSSLLIVRQEEVGSSGVQRAYRHAHRPKPATQSHQGEDARSSISADATEVQPRRARVTKPSVYNALHG